MNIMKTKLPKDILDYFKKEGSKGGKKGSSNLTPEQRKERARNAVKKRWEKHKTSTE